MARRGLLVREPGLLRQIHHRVMKARTLGTIALELPQAMFDDWETWETDDASGEKAEVGA